MITFFPNWAREIKLVSLESDWNVLSGKVNFKTVNQSKKVALEYITDDINP